MLAASRPSLYRAPATKPAGRRPTLLVGLCPHKCDLTRRIPGITTIERRLLIGLQHGRISYKMRCLMARGTRSRTPGKDDDKRRLLASLSPTDFPTLIADILYFSKGHRHVKVMDGPGDGCRDIQSIDKDEIAVITQCKRVEDLDKTVGSPDANELVVALTKFGKKRGIMATTGRFSPQLKREFTDNFPQFHLDWLDGADIVDEVFSHPLLFRAWVTGDTLGRETIYVKIPFVVRRATDDSLIELNDQDLDGGLSIDGRDSIDLGSIERFRPPEVVRWTESFGTHIRCGALLSTLPPDLHALEELHLQMLSKVFADVCDVVTVRFGIPHLVPTKKPEFEKGIRIPGFLPRSCVVRPGKPAVSEHDFVLLSLPNWKWPEYLSVAEADWGNWQSEDNQRWCHIEVWNPPFPNSTQSQLCRLIDASKRAELSETQAIFITATNEVCARVVAACALKPDIRCANGPGGELLGWTFQQRETRVFDRSIVFAAIEAEPGGTVVELEDAIHITSRSKYPLVPSPGGELYYPAQLVWDYDLLPSPLYLKGRTCAFVEFWKVPADVATASAKLHEMSFPMPDHWRLYMDCKGGPKTNQTFPLISVGVPWPLERSSNELVHEVATRVDDVFKGIEAVLREVWPDACRATSEFWEAEVRFPAGIYVPTEHGFERIDWWPGKIAEGDD